MKVFDYETILRIWNSRRLIFTWARYNIESTYFDTRLGLVWIILQPILMTVMYSLVFSMVLNRAPRGGVPFINFFLSGMILWLSFNNTTLRATTLVVKNVNLMGQINFPREVLVFAFFLEQLVDFLVGLTILFFLNAFYGYYPAVSYLYIPPLLFAFFLFELGVLFILATLGTFVRDIQNLVSLLLRLLFYFSAIIFPSNILPERVVMILSFNPIFFFVESFRNIIFYQEIPNLLHLILWFVFSFILFVFGLRFYQRKSGVFADYK